MANNLQSSIKRKSGEDEPSWIRRIITAFNRDIKYIASLFKTSYSGTFIDGDGNIVTVSEGVILTVEAPPLPETSLKLTWDDIGNALYTDVADYNTLFGSDFTTLTVDGNDQLLTGNSTTFAMPENAFNGNASIVAINDSIESISSIGNFAFGSCTSLTTASFPACTSIGLNVFENCASLTTATFPACTSVGENAFKICTSLTTVTFPACTTVGANAFQGCTSLTTVTLDACTTLGEAAFNECTTLTTVSLPQCTNLGGTTGDDSVFLSISGQTITLTVPTALATCDGGNPDGDIVSLDANNTATIIYV